jgi:hypothetical protein
MDNRINEFYEKYMGSLKSEAHDYGLLYFDHLYSEYLAIRSSVNPVSQALMDGLHERRADRDSPLTWNDIYLFDLELLKCLPPEDLSSKAYDMRTRYRNVAGEKEYEQYIASKPPDLTAAKATPVPTNPAQPGVAPTGQLDPAIELALREDIKYLLKVFYLNYSLMKVREGVREQLMRKGVTWTLWAVVAIAVFITLNDLGGNAAANSVLFRLTRGLTVGVVVVAGCVGGLMSMLQRIQSAPSEGDALFHLASLTNGWRGIFLAPLTGAVFSAVLFVLFAGGVLKGTIFPDIYTPNAAAGLGSLPQLRQSTPSPESRPTPSPVPSMTPTPNSTPSGTPTPTSSATPVATPTGEIKKTPKATPTSTIAKSAEATPTATTTPSSTPTPTPGGTDSSNSVAFSDFIQHTGPSSGVNYALLIIWSFIAGFLERLVPDALSKVVAKSNING